MRKAVAIGVIAALVALVLADALAARAGVVAGAIPRTDGPWLWVASRAAAVAAFVALTFEVAFGLAVSTGAGDGWVGRARAVDIHGWLSTVTLVLIAGHALALLGDGAVRFDALDAVVPFAARYRPVAVAAGVLAAWLAVAVHLSFGLRKRIGPRWWRRLHHATFALFALAVAHGLAAGSDGDRPWMRGLYLGAVALVGGLTLARLAPLMKRGWPARP
ncbi:MAG: ferric reductase-like transmembrane domain-containing protein [Deltaproteobacteria bacterium]|nr:ferric reductase-like transmembrane domain-containing protein [Deltaproteobacteria bacterium]